jgi:Methylase involved in ubiquinone/menaquinone biosynthesis
MRIVRLHLTKEMKIKNISTAPGHWILARMGKRVLRPGGKELTLKLVNLLAISPADDIVEFAPGLGFTAQLALQHDPNSYIGIDADEDAVQYLSRKINGKNRSIVLGNASQSSLPAGSKDKVFGEAMLTMHADHRKTEIIKEAYRILKPGGYYAIHELGLTPDAICKELKDKIQRELAMNIKVNARPLTQSEWVSILEKEGFRIRALEINPMHLLEPYRIVDDEGFLNAIKIGANILCNSKARVRILQMRRTFKKYQKHINAIVVMAEKV